MYRQEGASGQFDRIILNGHTFEWGSLTDGNWSSLMAEVNAWLPVNKWTCSVGQDYAAGYTGQDAGLTGQAAEFFESRVMALYEYTKASPALSVIFRDDTFAVKFEFYFVASGPDKDKGIIDTIGVFFDAEEGNSDDGYFQAEFDSEKLVINLADKYSFVTEGLKYERP